MEDLSTFNTEKVAMCIYNSSIPVVSAVGHETDFTVSDLAADMRLLRLRLRQSWFRRLKSSCLIT